MNEREFEQWCQTLNLPAATKELIASIRAAPPARRVQGRANNVSGTYPSRKMGVTIQFESHKVELWAIYLMEHDEQVLEFYDQPPSFKIQYANPTGRKIGHYHTPDFFVLRRDGAAWEEWKTEAQIQRLSEKYPTRYQRAEDGSWRCPPGEAHAEPLGLKYQVRAADKMNAASPADLREANRRFQKVMAYLQPPDPGIAPDIPKRTLSRWVKQFREAEIKDGCGYIGLLPKTRQRGNRTARAAAASRELLDTFIGSHFETPRQAPAASVYRAYCMACEQQNLAPLSQRTFYQRIGQRPQTEQTQKRQGAKAAYPTQPWHWELTRSTPRHGDRPLAIVHIDHSQLDVELRSATTGRLLGRPWVTLMVDAYSRRILALYLTFDPPSYRSCMMAIRICVQRFGRFPQAVVVDGGKEFHSIYFDTLLARYHCTKKTRPGAKPRFGSVIERLFGTTNTQFVFNNYQKRCVRQ